MSEDSSLNKVSPLNFFDELNIEPISLKDIEPIDLKAIKTQLKETHHLSGLIYSNK